MSYQWNKFGKLEDVALGERYVILTNENNEYKKMARYTYKESAVEVYEKANELKVIVYNKDDFRFAEEQASKVNSNCILYLQPEWSKRDKVVPEIVDYVMANPKWKVSLQTHKYLNIP